VLPPISRLCAVIDGTSTGAIAECLGLDANRYAGQTNSSGGADDWGFAAASMQDDEDRFRKCKPLMISSDIKSAPIKFNGILKFAEDRKSATTSPLPASQQKISNQLRLQSRRQIINYYNGWLKCDDPGCGVRSRQLSLRPDGHGQACVIPGCRGTMTPEVTGSDLYEGLKYYSTLLNVPRAHKRLAEFNRRQKQDSSKLKMQLPSKKEELKVWHSLKNEATGSLGRSGYFVIKPSLWSYVFGGSAPTKA